MPNQQHMESPRISSFQRIVRVISRMKRFCWNIKNQKRENVLTMEEIEEAENLLLKGIQVEEFGNDVLLLINDQQL